MTGSKIYRFSLVCVAAASLLCTSLAAQETNTIKAITYTEYGGPEVLKLEAIPKPTPGPGQILVKVRAAAANPLDWHFMRGEPYVMRLAGTGFLRPKDQRLGVDMAGEVEAVGPDVTALKTGDHVFGTVTGAFGEYVLATERQVVRKPLDITFEQAAGAPVAGLTALQALRDKGKLQAGQRVLINGASGGVGTFAVQIAKSMGAVVTGVTSTRNVELVTSAGADVVVDYTKDNFTEGSLPYDVVFDTVGNESLSDIRRVMTPSGIYIGVGAPSDDAWIGALWVPLKALVYSNFVSQSFVPFLSIGNREDLQALADLMAQRKVTPVIDRAYTLDQVPEAIRYLETGRARGKVIISIAPEVAEAAQ